MVFRWSLSDSKSPQVSRTLLSILADLSNAVVCMVSTRPLISKSSSPCISPWVTVSRPPITHGIIVTFMFHIFLIPKQGPGIYSSFHFFSILLCGQPKQQSPQSCKFSFFLFFFLLLIILIIVFCWLFIILLVVWLRLGDTFVSQYTRGVCASHFPGQVLGWAYTICSYDQTWISCKILSGSPYPPSRV